MLEGLELTLLVASVLFAILAVEQPRLYRAVMGLLGVTVAVGVLFFLLGAYQLAVLQLLVYAGGIIALFMIVIMLTRGVEE
ncbi:MAG: NADH-quinone oxidoreductase subunit J [Aigarchaeota archaeon]|nr:NADH-quinone oxidoreductase subunit J [Candidatus Pelearchaeum maunauluense]